MTNNNKQIINMTSKDLTKITVIKNLVNKLISTTQAEKQLMLSWRQIQRLKVPEFQFEAEHSVM
jgi:hypothetical protein